MGFWGTIVVACSPVPLAHRTELLGFGYQHRRVQDLGGGWQVLVTQGWQDPPDLALASEPLAAGTAAPVLAAYVCDGDCAALFTRLPEGRTDSWHLATHQVDCGNEHRPRPRARAAAEVVSELDIWARAAGVAPDAARLRAVVGYDKAASAHRSADELVYDLLPALGFTAPGEPHPVAFDIDAEPYARFVGNFGLAMIARGRAVSRQTRPDEVEQPWEAAAIRLELDLWAGLHRDDIDVATLQARAERLWADYRRSRPAESG
ncbi:hypothetical protein [Phytohabitans kaempferiae]|uniref:Uncharacterized protein n=1 Tax=Phytohabitans kaempferiae TaxID=1620943 RepID=A0ABV6MHB8_9ACTN